MHSDCLNPEEVMKLEPLQKMQSEQLKQSIIGKLNVYHAPYTNNKYLYWMNQSCLIHYWAQCMQMQYVF